MSPVALDVLQIELSDTATGRSVTFALHTEAMPDADAPRAELIQALMSAETYACKSCGAWQVDGLTSQDDLRDEALGEHLAECPGGAA